jgi:hypothetical protein
MADDIYIGGKQLSNPNNAQVQDSDSTELMSDSAVAQANPLGLSDKSPAVGGTEAVQPLQYAEEMADRGAPRDVNTWANQHGEADALMNNKEAWDEEDQNQRGLAQSKLRLISAGTHHIVQAPNGQRVAFPKGTPNDTMHSEMSKWWNATAQGAGKAWASVQNAATNAAQAIGLPSDQPEWQASTDEFMRDPVGKTTDVVGAVVGGLAHGFNTIIPNTPENQAMVARARNEIGHGNTLAAATTLIPLVGDNLAKAVKQAQSHDFSGSVGTTIGTVLPFLTESLKGEGDLPVTRETPVPETKTSYAHTPDQSGQFGNLEHAVTTKDADGKVVGHLAAQDTAPGQVTVRSNQIYDEAHRGQGKGTAQLRTLIQETAKDPSIKTVHSDISTTGAARGAWDKLAADHPDVVTTKDFNGTPQYTADLDKVRENAANAPEFNGEERRGAARGGLTSPVELEQNLKAGKPVVTAVDQTEGAMDTINRDIDKRLGQTVGTAEGAVKDTDLFAQAKAKLGPDASISDVAQEAQRMKTEAAPAYATLADAANDFNKQEGRAPVVHREVGPSPYAKRIADEYDRMEHNPWNEDVQRTYNAAKTDIDKQWDFAIQKMGIKFEPWDKEGQPYKNSKEMVADVKNNKHLYFFQGGEMPKDHPLAATDPKTGFSYNDKLRAIHDLFGHAVNENQFGPAGEERAAQEHIQMFSNDAIPAIVTETRGQNSWTNFGRHLRDEFGNVPEKGDAGYIPPTKRPFAENKAGLMPDWVHSPEGKMPNPLNPWASNYNPWAEDSQESMFREISKLHNADGGSTYNPRNGNMSGKEAYAVPMHPELSKVYDGTKTQPEDIKAYMRIPAVAEALRADPALSVGTWAHEGKTYYDLSATLPDRAKAIELGKKNNQIAIRDLKNGVDIDTGGTGTPNTSDQPNVGLKDLWTDETGTYTSGAFMRWLAKNKMLSPEGQGVLGDAAEKKVVPGWAEVSRFLTPADRDAASTAIRKNVVDLVNKWDPEWVKEAAKAGSAAKGWYQRAGALIQHIMGPDANRFTDFVASLSPQKDVEQNFADAFNFYNLWKSAGSPLGPENEAAIRDLTERAETGMSGQVARNQLYENLLHDAPPSGPKVSNFARNLKGNMQELTKDRWVAYMFGNNERMFRWFKEGTPKPAVHLAADSLMRAVGHVIGMEPAEVQETAWSFLRTVVNLTEKEGISPKEAVARLKDETIKEGSSELTRLIADSPKVQSALNQLATATGDERFRASNIIDSPKFKQLLKEHAEQQPTGGGLGAANKPTLVKGVKAAIKGRSSITDARNAKAAMAEADAEPAAKPKPKPKAAPKPKVDKATEFNPNDLSSNFRQRLNKTMENALS